MNKVGVLGETLAAKYLTQKGYQIIDRNWRIRGGEIDLVAKIGQTIIFVEVKTRSNSQFGVPEESVGKAKIDFIIRAALHYYAKHPYLPKSYRIDVIAIEIHQGQINRLEHIQSVTS